MGNSSGKEKVQEKPSSPEAEFIDGGFLTLQGVYTGPQEFKKSIVKQLQIDRRLAPFYKGLEDYEELWTDEELFCEIKKSVPNSQLLAYDIAYFIAGGSNLNVNVAGSNRPSRPNSFAEQNPSSPSRASRPRAQTVSSSSNTHNQPPSSPSSSPTLNHRAPLSSSLGISLYKNATECPICFLYYPPNIAYTRCCNQPICTECFVQIRRPNPHAPIVHADSPDPPPENPEELIMEPATCPYCVATDFGVLYYPPAFRIGIPPAPGTIKRAEVITTDRIRPDWTIKLQKAREKALRRAQNAALLNAHLLASNTRRERRRATASTGRADGSTRRRRGDEDDDNELAEAIRLSLLEEEERNRRALESAMTMTSDPDVSQFIGTSSGTATHTTGTISLQPPPPVLVPLSPPSTSSSTTPAVQINTSRFRSLNLNSHDRQSHSERHMEGFGDGDEDGDGWFGASPLPDVIYPPPPGSVHTAFHGGSREGDLLDDMLEHSRAGEQGHGRSKSSSVAHTQS